jgi:hypothetical protein
MAIVQQAIKESSLGPDAPPAGIIMVAMNRIERLTAIRSRSGGWSFDWRAWNPLARLEARGWVTVEALLKPRAYGRLP